jgi:hypothetical protein
MAARRKTAASGVARPVPSLVASSCRDRRMLFPREREGDVGGSPQVGDLKLPQPPPFLQDRALAVNRRHGLKYAD